MSQETNCNFIYGKESSILIFDGEVRSIKIKQINGLKNRIKFKINKVYKGEYIKKIFIYTSTNQTCNPDYHPCEFCGFNFEKGKKYIVYICSESSGIYETTKCTQTREIGTEEEEIFLKSDCY